MARKSAEVLRNAAENKETLTLDRSRWMTTTKRKLLSLRESCRNAATVA